MKTDLTCLIFIQIYFILPAFCPFDSLLATIQDLVGIILQVLFFFTPYHHANSICSHLLNSPIFLWVRRVYHTFSIFAFSVPSLNSLLYTAHDFPDCSNYKKDDGFECVDELGEDAEEGEQNDEVVCVVRVDSDVAKVHEDDEARDADLKGDLLEEYQLSFEGFVLYCDVGNVEEGQRLD